MIKKWCFKSIKQELIFYNVLLFGFMISVMAILGLSNLNTLSAYDDFSSDYSRLASFYKDVKAADQYAQSSLYTGSSEDLAQYKTYAERAQKSLSEINSMMQNNSLKWRVERLQNMLATYDEVYTQLREDKTLKVDIYRVKYDFLLNTAKNIEATATQYYNMITDEMDRLSSEMARNWQTQTRTIIFLTACMVIVAILFSVMCIKDITKPIGKIVNNIQKIKTGQYDLKQVKNAGEEIAALCEAFDDMAKSVKGHISSVEANAGLEKQLLAKENENLKISELLMETELKALQGQVNPHFFFNTLSMISKMAYMENATQTSEMMETVSELLRYSLDKASKTSDVAGEIECAENYMIIQRKRFGHRVRFELFVQGDVPNIIMPGMIIQPLIENAVIHGVGQVVQGAVVNVQVYTDSSKLYIIVEDNGAGMEDDVAENIISGKSRAVNETSKGTNIGMYNVMRRLEMFYGTAVTLRVESSIGCGTVVAITLPIDIQGGEEYV